MRDGERLWRMRKLHQHVDAAIDDRGRGGAELQAFYNGELVYRRQHGDRAAAIAEAASRRAELERSGWTSHW